MKVTPDRYLTYRYAGASGDFNPIHLDDEFARSVGLPGRILHGLWTMAQCARAQGDGLKLQSLSVQFRGMGVPEEEITVTTTAAGSVEATQGERLLHRPHRVAELQPRVPHRVPQPLGDSSDVGPSTVDEDHVDIALRAQLLPPVATGGDQRQAGLLAGRFREQCPQPVIDPRRPRPAPCTARD